jgi:hypothetical protein
MLKPRTLTINQKIGNATVLALKRFKRRRVSFGCAGLLSLGALWMRNSEMQGCGPSTFRSAAQP